MVSDDSFVGVEGIEMDVRLNAPSLVQVNLRGRIIDQSVCKPDISSCAYEEGVRLTVDPLERKTLTGRVVPYK